MVDRFVEKPDLPLARTLVDEGALWNVFIVAARASALLQRFVERFPQVVIDMRRVVAQNQFTPGISAAALDLYRDLPNIDFSRQILQGAESMLRVLRVPACGWSDLGTPKRLAKILQTLPHYPVYSEHPPDSQSGFLNLASQHARLPRMRAVA
jgi:mannose-1-phosphate guanylyltransferase